LESPVCSASCPSVKPRSTRRSFNRSWGHARNLDRCRCERSSARHSILGDNIIFSIGITPPHIILLVSARSVLKEPICLNCSFALLLAIATYISNGMILSLPFVHYNYCVIYYLFIMPDKALFTITYLCTFIIKCHDCFFKRQCLKNKHRINQICPLRVFV